MKFFNDTLDAHQEIKSVRLFYLKDMTIVTLNDEVTAVRR